MMMGYMFSILIGVIAGYGAYRAFLPTYRWLEERRIRRMVKKLRDQQTQHTTITPVVPRFSAGIPLGTGSVPIIGFHVFGALSDATDDEPLEETWSNEKIKAWRVISVTVKEGDPDGLWLGFPHPDGPTESVVIPVRHPIGVELHAECRSKLFPNCHTIPGEQCASTYGSGCGFYAFKTREQATEYLETEPTFTTYLERAVAHVLLSGKVIEHEDGYRAEILEVVSIEPAMPYRDSFSSTIEATRQAFDAYAHIFSKLTGSNFPDIVSRGV